MEYAGCVVNDQSKAISGEAPHVVLPGGIKVPISIIDGLPFLKIRKPTAKELKELPWIDITRPEKWDPSVLDYVVTEDCYQGTEEDVDTPVDPTMEILGREDEEEDICYKASIPDIVSLLVYYN